MLGNVNLQPPGQPPNHAQQQQQQQQQAQSQSLSAPPPPPLNGQDLNLSNILHFLQSEWRRYERDRNEWEIERAEMRVCHICNPIASPFVLISSFLFRLASHYWKEKGVRLKTLE